MVQWDNYYYWKFYFNFYSFQFGKLNFIFLQQLRHNFFVKFYLNYLNLVFFHSNLQFVIKIHFSWHYILDSGLQILRIFL
jgi:hypothetical protein